MILRPNQAYALQAIPEKIAAGARKICVVSPTGGGKSLIMFEQIERSGYSTALYSDRRMLFTQIKKGLESRGMEHGLRAAGFERDHAARIQLCMIQTEASRVLKRHGGVHRCRQVMIDEAHKNAGDTMLQLLDAHREAEQDLITIGFTATPLGIGHLYDTLIVAGTNSQLRKCGALLRAYVYGPDEPDTKWVGKIAVGEGECGLSNAKRMEYAQRVFGRVVENYWTLNPQQKPALLFAPGVAESKWFAEAFCDAGIPAAHIDGETVWLHGEEIPNSDEVRDELAELSRTGKIKVVCNRFVMREGIDWPWIYHGILATVFGSLTSYLQAVGRVLRAHPGMEHVILQDHGGNWWRHGSPNADREWDLGYTDRIVAGLREQRIREKKEPEPIVCPKCNACRLSGPECYECGFRYSKKTRPVLQRDGTLREMKGDIFRARRMLTPDQKIKSDWVNRVRAVRNSKKPSVQSMTFAQLEASFARDHNWCYPPHDLPFMPTRESDWFRPVREVAMEDLR